MRDSGQGETPDCATDIHGDEDEEVLTSTMCVPLPSGGQLAKRGQCIRRGAARCLEAVCQSFCPRRRKWLAVTSRRKG